LPVFQENLFDLIQSTSLVFETFHSLAREAIIAIEARFVLGESIIASHK
jgi:hypothetical protein